MYKCIKETNATYLNDLFSVQASDYQLRDSSRLIQPKLNTFKFGFKSFRYFGAKLWNGLPVDITQSESLSILKTRITNWCYSDSAGYGIGRENVLSVSLLFYYIFEVVSFVQQFYTRF